MKRLTPAHKALIKLLAEIAVEEFLEETTNAKKEELSHDAQTTNTPPYK